MKKNTQNNGHPTAVYVKDGDIFNLVGVQNPGGKFVTPGLGKHLSCNIDPQGQSYLKHYRNACLVMHDNERKGVKVLSAKVEGISEEELQEILFGALWFNFELLNNQGPYKLIPAQDRAEMLNMGFEMSYFEIEGILTESACITIETTRNWANVFSLYALWHGIENNTIGVGYPPPHMSDLWQPVKWVARVVNIEEARMLHKWESCLGELTSEGIYYVELHEGEDHNKWGYNPLMAFVPFTDFDGCLRSLTCFGNFQEDPFLQRKSAEYFDGKMYFIKVTKPLPDSGQTVGRFIILSKETVLARLGLTP